MVGDDPQRDILLGAFAVMSAGNGADVLHNVLDGIHLKEVAHILHHAGQPFQSHAGVDIGRAQQLVIASPSLSYWENTRFQISM